MVLEASLGRRLAAHATRLTHDADALAQELPQLTSPGLAGQGVERSAAHLRNLADAMSAHAREFDVGSSVEGAQPNVPKASGAVPAGPAEQRRIRQEEDVLAGLIQHVWSNGKVLTWLPPEAFAPGARREIYQAIRTLVFNREAVDDLTVQWQLARTSALTQAASTPIRADIRPQPPLHYAADLAARNVEDGSVMLAGRLLLHDYSSARAQTGTAAAPRGGQPAAVVRPRRAPQPAPLPDVSHTPGPPSPRPGGPSRQPGPEPRA
jgi:replicative DNA helicase